ncbi:MAG: helix-turn-helix transcriptional regulator [Clostridiaceae bacterium]|nr:helix-turn-helix transcriptional regulator [Clostridiaceae bacterium]
MADNKQMGNRIKKLRIRMGMTQEEFGELVDGSTKSIVSKWERGETSPNPMRKNILIHLGEQVGIDLSPNNEVEGLLEYAKAEFYRLYIEFIHNCMEKSDEKFQRAVLAIHPEKLKEMIIQSIYPTYHDQTITPADYETIIYDDLQLIIEGQVQSYPSTDEEIEKQLKIEIEELQAKLLLYYFTPDGTKYTIEELNTEKYHQLHDILESTRYQLENLQ